MDSKKAKEFEELFKKDDEKLIKLNKVNPNDYNNGLSIIRESEANQFNSNFTQSDMSTKNNLKTDPKKIKMSPFSNQDKHKNVANILLQIKRMSEYNLAQSPCMSRKAFTNGKGTISNFSFPTNKESLPKSHAKHNRKRGSNEFGEKLSMSSGYGELKSPTNIKKAQPKSPSFENNDSESKEENLSPGLFGECSSNDQTTHNIYRRVRPKRIETKIYQSPEEILPNNNKRRLSRLKDKEDLQLTPHRKDSYQPKINKVCQTHPRNPPQKKKYVLHDFKTFQTEPIAIINKTTQTLKLDLDKQNQAEDHIKILENKFLSFLSLNQNNPNNPELSNMLNFDGLNFKTLQKLKKELNIEKTNLITKFFRIQQRLNNIEQSLRRLLRKQNQEIILDSKRSTLQNFNTILSKSSKEELNIQTISLESQNNSQKSHKNKFCSIEDKPNIFNDNINKISNKTTIGIQSTNFEINDQDVIYTPKIVMKWRKIDNYPSSKRPYSTDSTSIGIQSKTIIPNSGIDQSQYLTSLVPIQEVKNLNIAYQYSQDNQSSFPRGHSCDYRILRGSDNYRSLKLDTNSKSIQPKSLFQSSQSKPKPIYLLHNHNTKKSTLKKPELKRFNIRKPKKPKKSTNKKKKSTIYRKRHHNRQPSNNRYSASYSPYHLV